MSVFCETGVLNGSARRVCVNICRWLSVVLVSPGSSGRRPRPWLPPVMDRSSCCNHHGIRVVNRRRRRGWYERSHRRSVAAAAEASLVLGNGREPASLTPMFVASPCSAAFTTAYPSEGGGDTKDQTREPHRLAVVVPGGFEEHHELRTLRVGCDEQLVPPPTRRETAGEGSGARPRVAQGVAGLIHRPRELFVRSGEPR
ncbi:hypothetical protein LZ30DRAFT_222783 [Colletotrichum cereale]|nr:hypothetical protein LZ30DRAFT_222783 [Colletotrichum cereale]